MRLLPFLCAAFISAGAAFAAEPSGIYSYPEDISDAQACAHACDEDALCMAWVFQGAGKCGLSAIAQTPSADSAVIVGISANAPRFMRHPMQSVASSVEAPVPATPAQAAAAEPAPHVDPTDLSPQALDDTGSETALLGGPDEGAIRSRLR